jgi:hypothetical protein
MGAQWELRNVGRAAHRIGSNATWVERNTWSIGCGDPLWSSPILHAPVWILG